MSRPLRIAIASSLFAAALAPSQALAWRHLDPPRAWVPSEDFPIQYLVSPPDLCEETVNDLDNNGTPDDPSYCVTAMEDAFHNWEIGAPCAGASGAYMGDIVKNKGFDFDYVNQMTYNDPGYDGDPTTAYDEDLPEPGTLAATQVYSGFDIALTFDGVAYKHSADSDIVFNNDVVFTTHEIASGSSCNGAIDMAAVATHEVGHLFGLDHSCLETETCTDPDLLAATMFWSTGNCIPDQFDIESDDIDSITALYGPSAQFVCTHQLQGGETVYGSVPFDIECKVVSEYASEITDVAWSFGDGSEEQTGSTVTHTYNDPGNYTVRVTVNGHNDDCGDWDNSFRQIGYVRACGVPEAAFEVEPVEGLTYRLKNLTDVSVYGCISEINWQVYKDGSNEPIFTYSSWEPKITFEEPGTYRAVVNVGGSAGTGAAELTFEVVNGSSLFSCNSTGTTAGFGLGGLAVAVGALVARRRR